MPRLPEPQSRSREQTPGAVKSADIPPGRYTLRQRIVLTWRYNGPVALGFRLLTFPVRVGPGRRLRARWRRTTPEQRAARQWYRRHGRPVTIVIPSFRDADRVRDLVTSLRRTVDRDRVRILVCDDASGSEHLQALRSIPGIEVVAGEHNGGFAANVNRGLRAADPAHDVVVLNSDTIARPRWLENLQYATAQNADVGIVAPKLLYPDGRIQFAGTVRHPSAPEWFDHRYRFRQHWFGPANVIAPALAVTGACMYITRQVLDDVGLLDDAYPMAYEDVDLCLRTWQAGMSVMYWPGAELLHLESVTRGTNVGERERESQKVFWRRWGDFFDARDVRARDGGLRVIYVTEDTGVGGGHRDIFEHLNGLSERGHHAELWSLAGEPKWFDLRVPVRTFDDYEALVAALEPLEAIKVATWWNTAAPVWSASVRHGIPVYFVQDIETSYYRDSEAMRNAVLASYRHEFRYMTISSWNRERLRELGLDAVLIPPGIDLETFRPQPGVPRSENMVLALGRTNPLKNLPLTLDAWHALPEPRPELVLFGIEPQIAAGQPGVRYVEAPSDEMVARLFAQATVFVQTSIHEGFCLPPLESMATGGAVVCTDAHGNRDFCRDGENCLMPEANVAAVSGAIARLLADPALRARFGSAGIGTAADYAWSRRLDALEGFLTDVAAPRTIELSTGAVPERRR